MQGIQRGYKDSLQETAQNISTVVSWGFLSKLSAMNVTGKKLLWAFDFGSKLTIGSQIHFHALSAHTPFAFPTTVFRFPCPFVQTKSNLKSESVNYCSDCAAPARQPMRPPIFVTESCHPARETVKINDSPWRSRSCVVEETSSDYLHWCRPHPAHVWLTPEAWPRGSPITKFNFRNCLLARKFIRNKLFIRNNVRHHTYTKI